MLLYVSDSMGLRVIEEEQLPRDEVITIEDYVQDKTQNYKCMILINNLQLHNEKPIIFTKVKAHAIFNLYRFSIRKFYIHPSAINWDFLEWYGNKHPMDILNLPLDDIDYELGKGALTIALHALEKDKYSPLWFSTIFTDMPMKFKDRKMCQWAYKNNPDLVSTFPREYSTYDQFYNLPTETFLWLKDVPVEYRDKNMCDKFLYSGSWGNKAMNLEYVPIELRTPELCEKLFKKSVNTIIYIPQEYITYDMCLTFAKNVGPIDHQTVIKTIPKGYQTHEFWKIYVAKNWYYHKNILNDVPIYLRTNEFIEECSSLIDTFFPSQMLNKYIKEKEDNYGKKWKDLENITGNIIF